MWSELQRKSDSVMVCLCLRRRHDGKDERRMSEKKIMLGNAAIARGAYEAGVKVVFDTEYKRNEKYHSFILVLRRSISGNPASGIGHPDTYLSGYAQPERVKVFLAMRGVDSSSNYQ